MDYKHMTAPCGLDCFNCHFYLAHDHEEPRQMIEAMAAMHGIDGSAMRCNGCRAHGGAIPLHNSWVTDRAPGEPCPAYKCSQERGVDFCYECDDFPCDYLHPWADRADKVPHNTKVFNLCLIKKMGLEKWAQEKAGLVRQTYFMKWWRL